MWAALLLSLLALKESYNNFTVEPNLIKMCSHTMPSRLSPADKFSGGMSNGS